MPLIPVLGYVSEFEAIQVGTVSSRPAGITETLSQKPKPKPKNKTPPPKYYQSKYFLVLKMFMKNIHFTLLNFLLPDSYHFAHVMSVLCTVYN